MEGNKKSIFKVAILLTLHTRKYVAQEVLLKHRFLFNARRRRVAFFFLAEIKKL